MKKRILVAGGRDFKDRDFVFYHLDNLRQWFAPIFLGIQGEATGVDTFARQWFEAQGMPCAGMRANWNFYGDAAGRLRNSWMEEWLTPDLVITFPGGRGTANMAKIAKEKKIDLHVIIKG